MGGRARKGGRYGGGGGQRRLREVNEREGREVKRGGTREGGVRKGGRYWGGGVGEG